MLLMLLLPHKKRTKVYLAGELGLICQYLFNRDVVIQIEKSSERAFATAQLISEYRCAYLYTFAEFLNGTIPNQCDVLKLFCTLIRHADLQWTRQAYPEIKYYEFSNGKE